jgi:hypothetical protein
MRRYIVLLLITGIVWAQTDFDTLVLKNGTTYLGEFSTIDGDNVYFKPKGASDFQSISIKQIERLELKFGQIVIAPGLKIEAKYQNEFTNKKKLWKKVIYHLVGFPLFIIITGGLIWKVILQNPFNQKN